MNASILTLILFFCSISFVFSASPANPGATVKARQVLNYLESLSSASSGCKIMSGQNIGSADSVQTGYNRYITELERQTGQWVAVCGGDYGWTHAGINVEYMNQPYINHWNAGGLVTLSMHPNNPWNGGDSWNRNNVNLGQLYTPGNTAYNTWHADLDRIASYLAHLRDHGVVVLWRPLHEMSGGWFWWGNNPSQYKPLYQDMFNYFQNKGLNNLLWVWCVAESAGNGMNAYYPGDAYVDIVAQDVYNPTIAGYSYSNLLSFGKPIALTEVGPSAHSGDGNYNYMQMGNELKNKYPRTTWFLAWNDWSGVSISLVTNQGVSTLLNDPCIINRDEITLGGSCTPQCNGKNCGSDSCGGSCGQCGGSQLCQSGTCVDVCTPDCNGRNCGSDSCGASCGQCSSADEICNAQGQCQVEGSELMIYSDDLNGFDAFPWSQRSSWAVRQTRQVYSGSHSFRMAVNGWGGTRFHKQGDSIRVGQWERLEFAIRDCSKNPIWSWVRTHQGDANKKLQVFDYIDQGSSSCKYRVARIPLSAYGLQTWHDLTDIELQEHSGDGGSIYLDSIRLATTSTNVEGATGPLTPMPTSSSGDDKSNTVVSGLPDWTFYLIVSIAGACLIAIIIGLIVAVIVGAVTMGVITHKRRHNHSNYQLMTETL